jgi:hypothetical protein
VPSGPCPQAACPAAACLTLLAAAGPHRLQLPAGGYHSVISAAGAAAEQLQDTVQTEGQVSLAESAEGLITWGWGGRAFLGQA